MISIRMTFPGGEERTIPVIRALTTAGSAADNGIVIDHPSVPACAIQLEKQADSLRMTALASSRRELPRMGGRAVQEAVLKVGDTLLLGEVRLTVCMPETSAQADSGEEKARAPAADAPGGDAMETLLKFSEAMLGNYQIGPLLRLMMDQVIELTHADRGFLLLMENGVPVVKVARNPRRENIPDGSVLLSESIVRKVLETRQPQLIHDALSDPDFSQSASVMSRGFLSVLCTPLIEKGEVIGLIYLGNDRFAHRFGERALELLKIWAAQGSLILSNALLMNELETDNETLREVMDTQHFGGLIGTSAAMRNIYRKIARVASANVSVLVVGETGTGKELVAREIHRRSPRAKGPFVTINCGAIPENLLESELFGHLRGAFTGAVATRRGKFQAADGGTLFLDEIGEMPLNLQVKILRALQERVVTKVGDSRADPIDIRVVAATNRVLKDEIRAGRFREDLYYRLNVVELELPPLRERGEDIPLLANAFLGRAVEEMGAKVKGFSSGALTAMRRYAWPGNVRELENRIKKAVVLAERSMLCDADLELDAGLPREIMTLAQAKEDFQHRYIDKVLELNNGNRTQTARDLDVDPRTIYRHLEAKRELQEGGDAGGGSRNKAS